MAWANLRAEIGEMFEEYGRGEESSEFVQGLWAKRLAQAALKKRRTLSPEERLRRRRLRSRRYYRRLCADPVFRDLLRARHAKNQRQRHQRWREEDPARWRALLERQGLRARIAKRRRHTVRPPLVCPHCGVSFSVLYGVGGARRRYCSDRCGDLARVKAYWRRLPVEVKRERLERQSHLRRQRIEARPPRTCASCQAPFRPVIRRGGTTPKCCSESCTREYRRAYDHDRYLRLKAERRRVQGPRPRKPSGPKDLAPLDIASAIRAWLAKGNTQTRLRLAARVQQSQLQRALRGGPLRAAARQRIAQAFAQLCGRAA